MYRKWQTSTPSRLSQPHSTMVDNLDTTTINSKSERDVEVTVVDIEPISPSSLYTSHPHSPTETARPTTPSLPCQPYSQRFFQKGDPELNAAKKFYLKAYSSGLLMVIITIFTVFSIYWGSLWKVPDSSLQGWIVDFDGGRVGKEVTDYLLPPNAPVHIIKWEVIPPSHFRRGVKDVISAVKDEQTWVAVVINSGASDSLQDTTTNPNASYNGSLAVTAYGAEARNENVYRVFVRPIVSSSLDNFRYNFTTKYASELSSAPNLSELLSVSPQTIVNPISYTLVNLIPFNQPVASAVVFVGLIYSLILSFFIVVIAFGARQLSGLNKLLTFKSLVLVRLVSSAAGYFFLSLFYSLLSLAFKLDLTRKYGQGGFMLFWMLNWFGMLANGLALESLMTLLTPQFIPFFMIFWIIINVSVCIFPIEILPKIFHYGYAVPFYNVSRSIRTIAFGTKSSIGLNLGVLIVWICISCVTLPAIQWYVRWKEIRAAKKIAPGGGVEAGSISGSGIKACDIQGRANFRKEEEDGVGNGNVVISPAPTASCSPSPSVAPSPSPSVCVTHADVEDDHDREVGGNPDQKDENEKEVETEGNVFPKPSEST